METSKKSLLGAIVAASLGISGSLIAAAPAFADASGYHYCSGSGANTLFTFSNGQIEHIHRDASNPNNHSAQFSPAGPTNFTTKAFWNSDNWYINGTDVASSRSIYCS